MYSSARERWQRVALHHIQTQKSRIRAQFHKATTVHISVEKFIGAAAAKVPVKYHRKRSLVQTKEPNSQICLTINRRRLIQFDPTLLCKWHGRTIGRKPRSIYPALTVSVLLTVKLFQWLEFFNQRLVLIF